MPLNNSRDCCVYNFERENGNWGEFSEQEKPHRGAVLRKLPRPVKGPPTLSFPWEESLHLVTRKTYTTLMNLEEVR